MTPIKALIVDDEPLARKNIEALLACYSDVRLDGSIGDPYQALAVLERQSVDLLFLDIKMPGLNGFALLEELVADSGRDLPYVIFVTAYDQYAIKAFECHAIDYLVKPFTDRRFEEAMIYARKRIQQDRENKRLMAFLGHRERLEPKRFCIEHNGKWVFLNQADVLWIEAADHYVVIHSVEERYVHRESLAHLEQRFPLFLRVHRSTLVNPDHVISLVRQPDGQSLDLTDGTRLTVSRRRLTAIRERLRQS